MSRRARITLWVLGVAGVALLVSLAIQRRHQLERATPEWLDPHQPPEGIANELTTLDSDRSWAANRCRPPRCVSPHYSAGSRVRRTYAPSLAASDSSLVRFSGEFALGGGC